MILYCEPEKMPGHASCLIVIDQKRNCRTLLQIVGFINLIISTFLDRIQQCNKLWCPLFPPHLSNCRSLSVQYIVVADNWIRIFRSSWLSSNGKFKGYANCASTAQLVSDLFSLLSYQLSQLIVDKARLWEPPRASCTIKHQCSTHEHLQQRSY